MTFFSTSEKLEIGGFPFVSNSVKPTRAEALEYYRRVAEVEKLNIRLFEAVENCQKSSDTEGYLVESTAQTYLVENIIVATGFFDTPVKLGVSGEDLPKVTHYYREPHPYYRQKVVVVGANNSAVDAALETYRKGADVTMVVRGHDIGARVKYWVRPDIVNRVKEGAIKVYYNSHLTEILPKKVAIKTPEGIEIIDNDWVIAATGYQPDFDFLSKIGIQLSFDERRYPSYDPQSQMSNMKNIYLAGVVCGGLDTHVWFIENSRIHAESIIQHILTHTPSVCG